MTGPTLPRDPEGLRARTIWVVAAATVAIALALTGVAWLLVVVPNGSPAAAQPSTLRREVFGTARDGADARENAARALERSEWIDRGQGVVHVRIEEAIDAVVEDPTLIGGSK